MMRHFLRMTAGLAAAGVIMAGICITGNAAGDGVSDMESFALTKEYLDGSSTQNNTRSPGEEFIFTIEPYGVWNAGSSTGIPGGTKYDVSNMPPLGVNGTNHVEVDGTKTTVTIQAQEGNAQKEGAKLSQTIELPTYDSVGDFWYKVKESNNQVAGVRYGTNDSQTEDNAKANGGHLAEYFIHVQVTNGSTDGTYCRTVTLHKTAPDAGASNLEYETWYQDNHENSEGMENKKTTAIQNRYYAGSLQITKSVTGNAGDKNQLFHINVEFKNPSDSSMKSPITYKNYYNGDGYFVTNDTSLNWTDIVTNGNHTALDCIVTFCVKDGTTVSFDNIPYGVTYTVTEEEPSDDKYSHTFAYDQDSAEQETVWNGVTLPADMVTAEEPDGADQGTAATVWDHAKASGAVTDELDHIIITNHKESAIDIGVITSDAPYIAILVLAAVIMVVHVRHRKGDIGE